MQEGKCDTSVPTLRAEIQTLRNEIRHLQISLEPYLHEIPRTKFVESQITAKENQISAKEYQITALQNQILNHGDSAGK